VSRPENQKKLEAADALARLADESGMSLIHLALAFVINHPAVTSAIIGPRTHEHLDSQLGAADVRLTDEILDRIDQTVRPGTDFSWTDTGYEPPSLTDPQQRRRSGP
jgi:aryl-alcohol dehydrogenase-like predicted oxidoreductase